MVAAHFAVRLEAGGANTKSGRVGETVMKISAKKGLLIGGGVLVGIVVVVVIVVLLGLDDIVKVAVERAGSKVTKVEVTLDEADVSPTKGTAALRGLLVGNPPGFKTDSAFALGEISVSLDIGSITEDTILVHEVVVTKPQVTYELDEDGGSNIDVIRANVESHGEKHAAAGSDSGGSGGSGGASDDAASEEDERKVIIENLYIRGGMVRVSAALLGGDTMDADLPDIHIADIGKDTGGATPDEVTAIVMEALTGEIVGFVGNLDLSGVLEGIEDLPAALEDLAGGQIEDAIKELEAGDSDAIEEIGQELENLFGN
jgi:hypothetical protein